MTENNYKCSDEEVSKKHFDYGFARPDYLLMQESGLNKLDYLGCIADSPV
jgi:hypothetical protein